MKLYVCWYTSDTGGKHSCGNAYKALKDAGYNPEVVKAYGWKVLPDIFNQTKGRKEVKQLTGDVTVPVLVTDSGEVVKESREIVKWAKEHPAAATATS